MRPLQVIKFSLELIKDGGSTLKNLDLDKF